MCAEVSRLVCAEVSRLMCVQRRVGFCACQDIARLKNLFGSIRMCCAESW